MLLQWTVWVLTYMQLIRHGYLLRHLGVRVDCSWNHTQFASYRLKTISRNWIWTAKRRPINRPHAILKYSSQIYLQMCVYDSPGFFSTWPFHHLLLRWSIEPIVIMFIWRQEIQFLKYASRHNSSSMCYSNLRTNSNGNLRFRPVSDEYKNVCLLVRGLHHGYHEY